MERKAWALPEELARRAERRNSSAAERAGGSGDAGGAGAAAPPALRRGCLLGRMQRMAGALPEELARRAERRNSSEGGAMRGVHACVF